MSAIARLLLEKGEKVQGSDSVKTPLLEELEKEGAKIFIGHEKGRLGSNTSLIYSSAISPQNPEWMEAKEKKLPIFHRSEALFELFKEKKGLVVAGTHGKTTTTSLLIEVLLKGNLSPSFAVGGIMNSLQTNAKMGKGAHVVLEGDESDGSFLRTKAFAAIVTNVEPDHLDFWKTEEELRFGFTTFFSQVKGDLFWCYDDAFLQKESPRGISYGFQEGAKLQLQDYRVEKEGCSFTLVFENKRYEKIALSLQGRHNALNASAVFGLALKLGVSEETIRAVFRFFQGVKRRLEKRRESKFLTVYDDYAHHPTEIQVTLKALREKVGKQRVVALFQPHRYTRLFHLFSSFQNAFDEADVVLITDVYAAREVSIASVSGKKLADAIGKKAHFVTKETVSAYLKPFDALLVMGAGDVTKWVDPIFDAFSSLKVAILAGGESPEHEISLLSAQTIRDALSNYAYTVSFFSLPKKGRWLSGPLLDTLLSHDVVIPVFHGPRGEDGMIQGLLESLHLPYVGCDYRASVLCMDKVWTKEVAIFLGIPTAPFVEINREKIDIRDLKYPLWVKPVHLGSSLGVSRVTSFEELEAAVEKAFSLDDRVLVEEEIVGRQIEFAVLGNEEIQVASPIEILNEGAFYDYEKKYGDNASGVEIPARISKLEEFLGKELAMKLYRSIGCKGLSRVDFFLDTEGHFWLNEINPFPGFTKTSGYPRAWEASGMPLRKLLDEMISLARRRGVFR